MVPFLAPSFVVPIFITHSTTNHNCFHRRTSNNGSHGAGWCRLFHAFFLRFFYGLPAFFMYIEGINWSSPKFSHAFGLVIVEKKVCTCLHVCFLLVNFINKLCNRLDTTWSEISEPITWLCIPINCHEKHLTCIVMYLELWFTE